MPVTDCENIQNCSPEEIQSPNLDELPQLYTTHFASQTIHCFSDQGEYLLWFPEVLCKVLLEFNYLDVFTACHYFQVRCVDCSPAQLKSLKQNNLVREDAIYSCLLPLFDAARLCDEGGLETLKNLCENIPFELQIYHNCFGRCNGLFLLNFHLSLNAPCIRCQECFEMMSPQEFVTHIHHKEKRVKKGNFVPVKWWKYIHVNEVSMPKFLSYRLLNELKYKFSAPLPFPTEARKSQQPRKQTDIHSPSTEDSAIDLSLSSSLST